MIERYFGTKAIFILVIIFCTLFILIGVVSIANAESSPKTEFTTHRKIDKETGTVCYTTVMLKNEEISELSMSCVSLPPICDYSERKVSKTNAEIQSWADDKD